MQNLVSSEREQQQRRVAESVVRVSGYAAHCWSPRRLGLVMSKAARSQGPARDMRLAPASADRAPAEGHAHVHKVCALLRQPDVRLVTLVGAPGVGKSRLAQAVAGAIGPEFADGAVLVDLARTRQSSRVALAVAEALRARTPVALSLLAELVGWLRGKHILLVLDNLERLEDGGPLVKRLLEACPRLRVVVTGRSGLGLAGEQRFTLRPTDRQPASAQPAVEEEHRLVRRVCGLSLQPAMLPEDQSHRLAPLTRREQVVATLLALGFTNAQIAEELVISYRTAETHSCRILRKLGLTSRTHVVTWAIERGLVVLAPRRSASGAA